jgi:type II secretory pathway pseudopilin PulG
MYNKTTKRRGFTLLEILAVISIVIVLLGLVIGLSSVVNEKSSEARARKDLVSIQQIVDDYKFEHGDFPVVLRQVLPPELKHDPWGSNYICNYAAYKSTAGPDRTVIQYIYGSMGRDNRPGFKGEDDDKDGGKPTDGWDKDGKSIGGTKRYMDVPDVGELGFGDDITNIR